MTWDEFPVEQIIAILRAVEIELGKGTTVAEACKVYAVSEQLYYRWCSEYGGLRLDQARRLIELERENAGLWRVVAGGKKATTLSQPETNSQGTAESSKMSSKIWWAAGGVCIIVFIAIAILIAGSGEAQKPRDVIAELTNAQPVNFAPDGVIAAIFNPGSKYTDVQRENALNELKGKVVSWRLPVYEVRRERNSYTIQTKAGIKFGNPGRDVVGTLISMTPTSLDDRQIIEDLKTNDTLAFRGVIADTFVIADTSGTFVRHLVIKPAILERAPAAAQLFQALPTTALAQAPQQQIQPQQSASLNDVKEIKTSLGIVAIMPSNPKFILGKKLFINGKPVVVGKGGAIENDHMAFVQRFTLPEGEVIILNENCNGTACGNVGSYRILVMGKGGNMSISPTFGYWQTEPQISNEKGKIVLNFGAEGAAVFENGSINISKELL